MLYYGGFTSHFGNVDTGDTVMDYLPAERQRGITINSAAISFTWRNQRINLIDTPGHADFTFEVERSVAVLDGAVAIIDGSAGVEAQTKVVWKQATKRGIPKVIFVNKMDRVGSSLGSTIRSIYTDLDCPYPLVLQLPVYSDGLQERKFLGILDILQQKMILWDTSDNKLGTDGTHVQELPIPESHMERFIEARNALVMSLCDVDETLCDEYLENEDSLAFTNDRLFKIIKQQTISGNVVPVLCGSSLKNIAVQPIMDAIIDYLPSPVEFYEKNASKETSSDKIISLDKRPLLAKIFKVIHHASRGILTYVRVNEGTLSRGMMMFNPRTKTSERAIRLYNVFADQTQEVDCISSGNIGVISGIKQFHTGDIIINKENSKNFHEYLSGNQSVISIPEPVCIASIEPHSLKDEPALLEALANMNREDPSFRYTQDLENGQLLIQGMGIMHLQVSYERLVSEFGARASLGKVQVGYRETLIDVSFNSVTLSTENKENLIINVYLIPISDEGDETLKKYFSEGEIQKVRSKGQEDGVLFYGWKPENSCTLPDHLSFQRIQENIYFGIVAGLSHGPLHGFPLTNLQSFCTISSFPSNDFPLSLLTQASMKATKNAVFSLYKRSPKSFRILEPYMDVTITTPEEYVGIVSKDLVGKRGATIKEITEIGKNAISKDSQIAIGILGERYLPADEPSSVKANNASSLLQSSSVIKCIRAQVPLEQILDYNSVISSLTKGNAKFLMSHPMESQTPKLVNYGSSFHPMSMQRQKRIFP